MLLCPITIFKMWITLVRCKHCVNFCIKVNHLVKCFSYVLQALTCFVVDHPITYLYNTLHYYHKILVQRAAYKRRLVTTIWSKLYTVNMSVETWGVKTLPFCEYISLGNPKTRIPDDEIS